MKCHIPIGPIILSLAFACCLYAAAGERENFVRTFGSRMIRDTSGTTLKIAAAKGTDLKPSVTLTWSKGDTVESAAKPLLKDGWFVCVQNISHVWVFDGEALSLLHKADQSLSDESSMEAFKTCPEEVRKALPESSRKKYFP